MGTQVTSREPNVYMWASDCEAAAARAAAAAFVNDADVFLMSAALNVAS